MKKENSIVKPQEPRARLTPLDVQQQQFRRSFRGYDEQEVDDFLDRVTEDVGAMLEEIETLKDQAGRALTTPVEGASDAAEASRAVADITRRAREEADAIIRDAEARAAAILTASGAGAGADPALGGAEQSNHLSRFVSRERGFLQELASLIQSHAEAIKQMVQEARGRTVAQEVRGQTAAPPSPGAAPAAEVATREPERQAAARSVSFPPPPSFGPGRQQDLEPAVAEASGPGTPDAEEEPETPRRVIEVPDADAAARVTIGASDDQDEDEAAARERKARERDSSLSELFWGED
jgi:cell division initiation protein